MQKFLVGGAVRDKLMGIEPNDLDFVIVGSTIDEMIAKGYKQVGKEFPVFLDEDGNELALARKDIKNGDKHTDFIFDFSENVELEDDLRRRDLTVNAIAMDNDGNIIDPFNGCEDIKNKILNVVDKEHFKDDCLRLFRVARFAAQLEFDVSEETMQLLKEMVVDGCLNHLTPERVWKETEKALKYGNASHKFFETLKECGALEFWFKEVFDLIGVPERLEFHPSGNTFNHTMFALESVQYCDADVKFAVLCHDFGKALTPKDILPKHIGHENRGDEPINNLCDRLKVPNDFRELALTFCKNHMKFHKVLVMKESKVFEFVKTCSDRFKNKEKLEKLLDCFRGDHFGEKNNRTIIHINAWLNIATKMFDICKSMENVTLDDFQDSWKEKLSKLKGVDFGKQYNEYLWLYFSRKMEK